MKALFYFSLFFSVCFSLKQETARARLNEQGIKKLIQTGIQKAKRSILSSPIPDQSISGERAWATVQNIHLLEVPDQSIGFNLENKESVFFFEGGKGKFKADVLVGMNFLGMSTTFNWQVVGKVSFGSTVLRWYLINPTLADKNETNFNFIEKECSAGVNDIIVDVSGGVSGVILDTIEPLFRPALVGIVNVQICKIIKNYILPQVNENLLFAVNDQFAGKLDRIRLDQQGSYIAFATDILPKVNGNNCSPSATSPIIWSNPAAAMLNAWAGSDFVRCYLLGRENKELIRNIERELIKAATAASGKQIPGSQPTVSSIKVVELENTTLQIDQSLLRVEIPIQVAFDFHGTPQVENGNVLLVGSFSHDSKARLRFDAKTIQLTTRSYRLRLNDSQKRELQQSTNFIEILNKNLANLGITVVEPSQITMESGHIRLDLYFE